MDECLELLSKSRASPFDELFIQQVRLQLVAEQVEKAKGTTVPPAFYLKDLRFKANEIKANLPPHLQQDGEFAVVGFGQTDIENGRMSCPLIIT